MHNEGGQIMAIKFIISLLMALLVAVFAIQNAGSVEINVLLAKYTMSQALVILISAISGAIVVLLLGTVQQVKLTMKLKSTEKTVSRLEEENRALKANMETMEAKLINTGDVQEVLTDNMCEVVKIK